MTSPLALLKTDQTPFNTYSEEDLTETSHSGGPWYARLSYAYTKWFGSPDRYAGDPVEHAFPDNLYRVSYEAMYSKTP